ncbi:MAG: DeoR/GlpR transcriptional regulator [Firmicutes bacterium]|nr:DeoR/GlpR transcriptional regulator [Bacillota bacterium]
MKVGQLSVLPFERQLAILEALKEKGTIDVLTLARSLGVSANTLRRDLTFLESKGYLRRVYGGATIMTVSPLEAKYVNYNTRTALASERKDIIGMVAADMIEDGDTVILDSGTTTLQIARHLEGRHNVTVITNDIKVAAELCGKRGILVVTTGGFTDESFSSSGVIAERTIAEVRPDKVFLSSLGVSVKDGLTDGRMEQATIKRVMANAGREVILVADSSKVGKVLSCFICPVSAITRWITDDGVPPNVIAGVEKEGCEVIIAGREGGRAEQRGYLRR